MASQVSNVNLRNRLTQVIILVVLILGGVLISQVAGAQIFSKKVRYDSRKYRIAVHRNSDKACYIMHKKRTSSPKHPLVASGSRRNRNDQPMAETEEPQRLRASN